MEKSSEYLGLFVTFLIAAAIAGLILFLNKILGPKNAPVERAEPFECGMTPFAQGSHRFSIKFYLIVMLFILFDVEIVWFFPWAVILRELRWTGFVEMTLFASVLVLGFAYAWKKGALEWEK